jgi:hypothetical protein
MSRYQVISDKLVDGNRVRPATDAEIAMWKECERLRDVLKRAYEKLTAQSGASPPTDWLDAA